MKYKRMLCWLKANDEERLNKFDLTNAPIVFVHSSEEFISSITPESFVICSLQFAENNIEEILKITRKFPNIIFHMFAIYDEELTLDGFSIGFEPNVVKESLLAEEVIEKIKELLEFGEILHK